MDMGAEHEMRELDLAYKKGKLDAYADIKNLSEFFASQAMQLAAFNAGVNAAITEHFIQSAGGDLRYGLVGGHSITCSCGQVFASTDQPPAEELWREHVRQVLIKR